MTPTGGCGWAYPQEKRDQKFFQEIKNFAALSKKLFGEAEDP
jgi:hypothetical protein